ncbi:hypothetical protein ACJJI5_15625 [Microbulbifer sp. EKSA008]|uniref:hypothetical protein n=1 Tax=unclassified Microbulbifer TaxID=2619833 RepID=UPI004042CBFE
MLIVSSVLPIKTQEVLKELYDIDILDRYKLRDLALASPELTDELDSLIEIEPQFTNNQSTTPFELGTLIKETPINHTIDDEGTKLSEELTSLPKGKEDWRNYEALCIKILKYLFENELDGWSAQKTTDDGLHRYDLVCRVRSNSAFWKLIAQSLGSHYIIFEFKNYTNKIQQEQVLTTEKYLLERALRKVAIVLTREGASDNANKMIQGAMREHGKLILTLTDQDLISMLEAKEQGEDPSDKLFDLTDTFLLGLPR